MTTKTRATGTTEPPAPPEAPVDDGDQADEKANPDAVGAAPAESKAERARRLRAELAELERNDAGIEQAEPTHLLLLGNGQTVESANPGATHHAVEEGGPSYPVIKVFPLA